MSNLETNVHFPPPRNYDHYYNLPDQKRVFVNKNNFSCNVCNKFFSNKFKYEQHVSEHVECPFPECGLKADMKVIDQHITNQHMLVNFEALQMDDEAWRAERKKRFPTRERAEMRRMELQERVNRGERIGLDKKRSNKFKKNDQNEKLNKTESSSKKNVRNEKLIKTEGTSEKKSFMKQRKKREFRKERKVKYVEPISVVEIEDVYDSDEDNRFGLPLFRGTKKFYEDCGERSYFSTKNAEGDGDNDEINVVENKSFNISDDDDDFDTLDAKNNIKTNSSPIPKLSNALGSLMGAYSDSEEEEEETVPSNSSKSEKEKAKPNSSKSEEKAKPDSSKLEEEKAKPDSSQLEEEKMEVTTSNSSKVELDDGIKEENIEIPMSDVTENKRRRKRHHNRTNSKDDKSKKRKVVANPKKKRITLLERLLQSDIRHERNVILQCIRYIVQNNVFQIKS